MVDIILIYIPYVHCVILYGIYMGHSMGTDFY